MSKKAPRGVVLLDTARAFPGYRLYAIQMLGSAELLSLTGTVVRRWEQPGDRWVRAELLPNGDLLVIGMEKCGWVEGQTAVPVLDDTLRYVMRMNWAGEILWKKRLPAHHDIEQTPDGNLLLLGFQRRSIPRINKEVDIRDDQLILINRDGEVLTSRSMFDAVERDPKMFELQKGPITDLAGRPWIDLFHANSVEWLRYKQLYNRDLIYGPDNVLVSIRHQDRVAIYNWKMDKWVWSWGREKISGPHDAHMLENGNILIFDNGLNRTWSRVIELNPLTKTIVWTYQSDPKEEFFTASKGSCQRLANGNTLMAESDKGRAIEVTSEGEIVWEFICPHSVGRHNVAAIIRMVNYEQAFIDSLLKRD